MAWVGGDVSSLFSVLMIAILSTTTSIVTQVFSTSTTGFDTQETLHDSVRWDPLHFGPCSSPCQGVQERRFRCIKFETGDSTDGKEVPTSLCPLPYPRETQPCNTHPCTAQWRLGDWSECSATCGIGTQKRDIECVAWLHGSIVSRKECGLPSPETSQKCHVTTCPNDVGDVMILAQNYSLIQLRRIKKLKLVVGGDVKLLPGQNVVVKCPVKNHTKKTVKWSKDYRLVKLMGRVKSDFGQLHITNADPNQDRGIYTCQAKDKNASINIQFLREQDPELSTYKKWIQSKAHVQKFQTSNNTDGEGQGQLVQTSTRPVDVDQQRDQSLNTSSWPTYITGEWSECPAVCEAKGQTKRTVSCAHVTSKYVKLIPDEECQKIGLLKPETIGICGQHCAVWKPGPWSQCHGPKCGHMGEKRRPLLCIWKSTRQDAAGSCLMDKRPITTKKCKFKCPNKCKDRTKSCVLAGLLKMCRYPIFRKECCATCHARSNSAS
ncbi:unnamed protein product [Lymnaea stagnalis]|uniref:ADAMTS-like protein 3 n=1 Tax=Lymnaea stagnalis TaxID=6523 RepID=A0AAV2HD75_LYMST